MRCLHEAVVDAFSTIRGYEALVAGVRSYWFCGCIRQGPDPIITLFITLFIILLVPSMLVTAVTAILLVF